MVSPWNWSAEMPALMSTPLVLRMRVEVNQWPMRGRGPRLRLTWPARNSVRPVSTLKSERKSFNGSSVDGSSKSVPSVLGVQSGMFAPFGT